MISNFQSLVETVTLDVLTPIVAILFTLALVYFLVGVFKYIQSAGDEGKREEGIKMMIYGLIGLFVFVSVWGLVTVLQRTFSFNSNAPIQPPPLR